MKNIKAFIKRLEECNDINREMIEKNRSEIFGLIHDIRNNRRKIEENKKTILILKTLIKD